MPEEKAPEFRITAEDPAFLPTLREYAMATGSNRDLPPKERRVRLDEIDELVRQAKAYQGSRKSRKKDLDLKRQWDTVERVPPEGG